MKIGIVTNLYPPLARGGAEWLTYLMAQDFVKKGHELVVITLANPTAPNSDHGVGQMQEGVRVYRFNPGYIYHYLNAAKFPKVLRIVWQIQNLVNIPLHNQIVKILSAERCELIISSNLMGLTFNLPRSLKKNTRNYYHIVHDVQLLHPSGLFMLGEKRGGLGENVFQAITRWLFGSPSVVIFPSQWLLNEYQSRGFFYNSKKIVLRNPNAVNLTTSNNNGKNQLTMLYVGQPEIHKGIFWLIDVFKAIPDSKWNLEIVLVGDESAKTRIKELVAYDKRVAVFDNLPQSEINEKYKRATLVVVPSLCMENAPVSIQMALSAGTPVLAADVGGVPEIVIDNENGLLYKSGDKDSFYNKLHSLTPDELTIISDKIKKNHHGTTMSEYADGLISMVE